MTGVQTCALPIWLIEHGLKMDAVTFKRLELMRQRAWAQLAAVHRDYDALLCPTMAQLPLPIDTDEYAHYRTQDDGRYYALDMTSQFNFTSPCPALSVPAGWSDEGLPVGLQIVTRKDRDDVALRIAAIESWVQSRAEDWARGRARLDARALFETAEDLREARGWLDTPINKPLALERILWRVAAIGGARRR